MLLRNDQANNIDNFCLIMYYKKKFVNLNY